MSAENATEVIAKALQSPIPEAIAKAFTSPSSPTTGLAEYNLEQGARLIYPIDTPLRNMIPREVGQAGVQANWRAITAVNPNEEAIGVSEGNRGGYNSYTEVDRYAKFVEMGLEDYVTWKAERAAGNFQNLDELAVQMLLQATMEAEEKVMLGGLGATGLGTTPTPTVANSGSGGSIAAATYNVVAVALTFKGQRASSVANGVKLQYTRTNADGSTDTVSGFYAKPSNGATTTTTGTTSSVTASVTAVPGAFGYAWYIGVSGSEKLAAITSINSVVITALNGSGQALSALATSDQSTDSLVFDGLIGQMIASGSGSYINSLATGTAGTGTKLTSTGSGTGGIAEFDAAIESFFTNYRLIPTDIWISGADQKAIKALILAGNTNAAVFFQGGDNEIKAGARVRTYTNPIGYGNPDLRLRVHPFLPQGTVLFTTDKVPYPLSNVRQIMKMNLRRDYYSILWPLKSRRYEYGVYFDGVLQHYFPASMGMINNIAPG
ncbi:MAG: hypothetical protein KGO96_13515 [Elusimicrobia bacterium]|nr:hypothetical protein [Elusimicrobiota bacterium]